MTRVMTCLSLFNMDVFANTLRNFMIAKLSRAPRETIDIWKNLQLPGTYGRDSSSSSPPMLGMASASSFLPIMGNGGVVRDPYPSSYSSSFLPGNGGKNRMWSDDAPPAAAAGGNFPIKDVEYPTQSQSEYGLSPPLQILFEKLKMQLGGFYTDEEVLDAIFGIKDIETYSQKEQINKVKTYLQRPLRRGGRNRRNLQTIRIRKRCKIGKSRTMTNKIRKTQRMVAQIRKMGKMTNKTNKTTNKTRNQRNRRNRRKTQ